MGEQREHSQLCLSIIAAGALAGGHAATAEAAAKLASDCFKLIKEESQPNPKPMKML